MGLLRGVLCRNASWRLLPVWFGVDGLLAFYMATEAVAHGREHLFAKSVILPRAESSIQRGREDVRRDSLLDGGFYRPAAFAGILHKAGIGL